MPQDDGAAARQRLQRTPGLRKHQIVVPKDFLRARDLCTHPAACNRQFQTGEHARLTQRPEIRIVRGIIAER
jgi:hypothetical protein